MSNLHKQLLELGSQQHSARTTAAAAAADDDDEDDVKSQLKSFDDAVFSVLRQRAAQCDFSACVEVSHSIIYSFAIVQHSRRLLHTG